MKNGRPVLGFVSPVFLFPNDAGGKIRTTNILRGLKGGAFHVVLASPEGVGDQQRWKAELASICDEFVGWQEVPKPNRWLRAVDVLDRLPLNVKADVSRPALRAARDLCARSDVDVIVFDFVHSAALMPGSIGAPSVCFTHNVEAEIFKRHAQTESHRLMRWVWRNQHRKMVRFEQEALQRFDRVVAVSERDQQHFQRDYGLERVVSIPTGVDLDFFSYAEVPHPNEPGQASSGPTVVFTGSMDWDANSGGVAWFLDQAWPLIRQEVPNARFRVVGRHPPRWLQHKGAEAGGVEFTGFVDDVRQHVRDAQAFVVPLLVGGGTRIKAFEAMAMGIPVVSTGLGMEGLEVEEDVHYLRADSPQGLSACICRLMREPDLRSRLALAARRRVEDRFGHRVAASAFESICLDVIRPRPSGRVELGLTPCRIAH